MCYRELQDYLNLWRRQTNVQIEWAVIQPDQITACAAGCRMGLQIADAVAGSFSCAVQPRRRGLTEDRYARMLRPVVYQRLGRYREYGLKFLPPEVDTMLNREERFQWVRENYE